MDKLQVTYIDPIDPTDLSIFLDCEITDNDGNTIPLNDVGVVISIFDTTQNFIDQKIVKGNKFRYNFQTESDLLNYIYNNILEIDNNDNLNPGIYELRFSFILDTFESIDNIDNRFIVTEISPDGTEVRLNPLSNNENFIEIFSKIKEHKKSDKKIELNESGFVSFYRTYVNSVFSNSSINDIFSDSEVRVYGKGISEYLADVYEARSSISNDFERRADAKQKAENIIEDMKSLLTSKKEDAFIFISQYFDSIKSELFSKLNSTAINDTISRTEIINEFKVAIKNQMKLFLNNSIDEIIDSTLIN